MMDIKKTADGVIFKVFVQPRSSKNMVSGAHGDALKIKLTAPPVEGAANKMCVRFLADFLNIPKSRLEIVSGHSSRSKRICVRCENAESAKNDIIRRIQSAVDS